MTLSNFIDTLFDKEQDTCYSTTPYGTSISGWPNEFDVFFSINAMHTSRADANVTCFRNFLIELDDMPLEGQLEYVESKVPVTSIVYSGSKSYHFIISLETPLTSIEDYRHVAKRLHALLPAADKSTKNPSRFSRLPGVVRPETGNKQYLHTLNSRVLNAELFALLPEIAEPVLSTATKGFTPVAIFDTLLKPDEKMQKLGITGRNAFFFWLGQRLLEAKLDNATKAHIVITTYSNLKNQTGFSEAEAFAAARIGR